MRISISNTNSPKIVGQFWLSILPWRLTFHSQLSFQSLFFQEKKLPIVCHPCPIQFGQAITYTAIELGCIYIPVFISHYGHS